MPAEVARLSEVLHQLCSSAYSSQELAAQRARELSAGPWRMRGLLQENEHAVHRLAVAKARLAIERDCLRKQSELLSQAMQQVEFMDACYAGGWP
jgi:hypothetical protein